ncbi:MAG: vitamin B12-dependent ribonucleotide reductase, partial [Phycisphaerales bacterium]|nr:vitamin B12-dependent ribonucleotide reductase [Phycisphaerales bacterium]
KDSYRLSWELGLKANALYRDGCKLSQPLNSKSDTETELEDDTILDELDHSMALDEVATDVAELAEAVADDNVRVVIQKEVEIVHRPMRRRLPETRNSLTHKFNVAGHEGYLTVGCYEDGMPGELFITMAKEGSTIGGLMDSLGTSTSVALQYGVPLESLVRKFTHQRFEPAGMTTNRDIPFAKSLVDYIFRWLGMEFIDGYREANIPARSTPEPKAQADKPDPIVRRMAVEAIESKPSEKQSSEKPVQKKVVESMMKAELTETRVTASTSDGTKVDARSATLSMALDAAGDAPPCDVCGTITVRSGTCYKCLNCGASMGCS